MRRFVLALVATVAGLVVLLSFKTSSSRGLNRSVALGSETPGSTDGAASPAASGAASMTSAPASTPASPQSAPSRTTSPTPRVSPTAKPSATPAAATKTATGSRVEVSEGFRTFGTVQVRVTMTGGRITADTAIDYPRNDPQSYEISSYSIPVLQQEALTAQGAHIDIVSGATYTSDAYAQSLQAALDKLK